MARTQDLSIAVEGDELVVRIGIETLANAAEHCDHFNPFHEATNDFYRAFKIRNKAEFAKGVCLALLQEEEDGSNVIERALDNGFLHAIEGDYGVDELPQPIEKRESPA